MLGHGRFEVTTIPECLQLLTENIVQRLVTGVRNAVRFAYHADELIHESMQSIQTSLGLIFSMALRTCLASTSKSRSSAMAVNTSSSPSVDH